MFPMFTEVEIQPLNTAIGRRPFYKGLTIMIRASGNVSRHFQLDTLSYLGGLHLLVWIGVKP